MKLTGVATRALNTPVLMEENKLATIVQHVILPRLEGRDISAIPLEAITLSADQGDRKPYLLTSDGIAVINVDDTLVRKASGLDAYSGLTSYQQIQSELQDAKNDSGVKGILLQIDSPGGEVGGLFDLADSIYGMRGTKPIYAAVSEMACSAAYAIASATDKIFLTRTSMVGSIGVVCAHVDQSAFDEKMGIKVTYIFAGKQKVDGNPHEPLSDSAEAKFQAEIDKTYDLFVATVARNRGISGKAVRATEAGIYSGEDGVKAGLADQVGTPDDAYAALLEAASDPGRFTATRSNFAATTTQLEQYEESEVKTERHSMANEPLVVKKRNLAEIDAEIQKRALALSERTGLTIQQATAKTLENNPALYAEHKRAHRVRAFTSQFE